MILEMIVWGFFSALGWMGANWTVEKIKGEPTELRCDQPATSGNTNSVPTQVRKSCEAEGKGS
jgi:hypothetical protein